MLAVVTAFIGAAMVSLGGNVPSIVEAVETLDPSVIPLDVFSLVFVAVFVLGLLSQGWQLVSAVADPENGEESEGGEETGASAS